MDCANNHFYADEVYVLCTKQSESFYTNIIILVATGEHSDVMELGLRLTMTGLSLRMPEDWRRSLVSLTMLLIGLAMTMTVVTTWEPISLDSITSGTLMRRK